MGTFLVAPLTWHSNYISFACIGAGALVALSERVLAAVARLGHIVPWLAAIAILLLGPLYVPAKPMQALMPAILVFIIFAGREIAAVRNTLAMPIFQVIGLASYSLYLRQQVFLAKPDLSTGAPRLRGCYPLW